MLAKPYPSRKRWRKFLFCSVTLLLLNSCTVLPAISKDIVLGMSAAFSGPSQDLGCKLYGGAMAYIRYINEQGGVAGNALKLLALDDGYNPEPTIANTIQFVEQNNVFCLFNYVGTPTVTRMLPLLTKYQARPLFLLFPFTGANALYEQLYRHRIFEFRTSYDAEIRALIDMFIKKRCSRFAILYQTDAYGRSGWQSTVHTLKEHGMTLVAQASYPRGKLFQGNFHSEVSLLKKHNPDVIICIAASQAAAGFIRDTRDLGLNVPIANISFVDPDTIASLLGTLQPKKRTNYLQNLINSQVVPFFSDPSLPAGREFMELNRLFQKQGMQTTMFKACQTCYSPGPISFEGFLNAKILVELLKRMGASPRAQDLPEAFAKLEGLDIGIGAPLHVDTNTNQIQNQVHFITFANGTIAPIDPTSFQGIIQ
ncbi:MAG: ABC transporter substrate-binding protein [Desulfoplanes sp.]|nr:ABC transporter substrate-binding protein [Desulfoplanes sp.]